MNNKKFYKILKQLKNNSGTHSPSIDTIMEKCPELKIKVDACFLSNPYATNLFMEFFEKEIVKKNKLRELLEFYPPQNREIAKHISKSVNIPHKNIFVGNGAIEIIQAILHNFLENKICVISPTFSSYYEFVKNSKEIVYFKLKKSEDYQLYPNKYIDFIKKEKPDTVVIINPNNPNGGYLNKKDFLYVIENLSHVKNVIIDESFIHFAYENVNLFQITSEKLIKKFSNLIIIKSMSKDFGIAGIRAGYAVMSIEKVNYLLENGYLWNVSGLSNYFFKTYSQKTFINKYEIIRKKYIMNTLMFLNELSNLDKIKVYPTKANFALVEIKNGMSSFDFSIKLLIEYGVYVRDCSDKIGLNGEFIRIASRSFEENLLIIDSMKKILNESN
tara:strand:- start:10903 stop:12063 length:1161 start_codon:yes stop_codon:yes gene_type:complete